MGFTLYENLEGYEKAVRERVRNRIGISGGGAE